MIMLVGDKTRDAITEKAKSFSAEQIYDSGKELLKSIFSDIIDVDGKREELIYLISNIQRRLGIFYRDAEPTLFRTIQRKIGIYSFFRTREMLTCESDFNINYNKIVGRDENFRGGSYLDEFVLSNIISVLFLNKFVGMVRYNLNGSLLVTQNLIILDNLYNSILIINYKFIYF